jgi:hypothetical protein
MELMNLYGSDPPFAHELEQLGATADRVAKLDSDLRQDPSPESKAYLERLDDMSSRYGLNLLPSVELDRDPWGFPFHQPSGKDFIHAWCFKRRGPRSLPPERLGEAAGYSGEVPTVQVKVDAEWEPTRESRQEFRRRVARRIAEQIDAGLNQRRTHGYTFGGRRPSKRAAAHLRWLFERMRFRGKDGLYAEISKRAEARGELSPSGRVDPEDAEAEVVKAVTALADSIGITIRERGME